MNEINKVSIVIPVYNSEATLTRCVESLVFGNYKNLEIILVDDLSVDNSWTICEQLAETYPGVFCYKNPQNKGVSYTRNTGIEKSTGDFIMFVDSDDWVSGQYVELMTETLQKNLNSLVICGHCFLDLLNNTKKTVLWDKAEDSLSIVCKDDYFELVSASLMKQVWDKIFVRNTILEKKIRFDEKQSMGEDFQFVLEYLKAAEIPQCVIVNKPLYYYVRSNNSSLMSKFGLIENNTDEQKLKLLFDICGHDSPKAADDYERELNATKHSYVYWICHNKKYSRDQKLKYIEQTFKDGNSKAYYMHENVIMLKEFVMQSLIKIKLLPSDLAANLRFEAGKIKSKYMISKLQNRNVSLITQNGISQQFYDDMDAVYASPTIGTRFEIEDFVKLIANLEHYLNVTPVMKWGEQYPEGCLEDIKIEFTGFNTCTEALTKWEQRKKSIDLENIVVCAVDDGSFNNEILELWYQCKYPKVLLTSNSKYKNLPNTIFFTDLNALKDEYALIKNRLYYQNSVLINVINKTDNKD